MESKRRSEIFLRQFTGTYRYSSSVCIDRDRDWWNVEGKRKEKGQMLISQYFSLFMGPIICLEISRPSPCNASHIVKQKYSKPPSVDTTRW